MAVSVPAAMGGVFEMIVYVVAFFASAAIVFLPYAIVFLPYIIKQKIKRKQICNQAKTEPFIVSEYYDRMEKAALDILEYQEPVDQIIILWWGLDGLRLNEDGTLEWVNRRKPKPIQENAFYQLCQFVPAYDPNLLAQTQSTRSSIDALMAQNENLRMQALHAQQTMQLISSLQQCCVQNPAQYPPYFYGW